MSSEAPPPPPPPRRHSGQTGSHGWYEVVHERVAVRSSPSTRASLLGGLERGQLVHGLLHVSGCAPWLFLDQHTRDQLGIEKEVKAWVLIHGGSVGLGELLRAVYSHHRSDIVVKVSQDCRGETGLLFTEAEPGLLQVDMVAADRPELRGVWVGDVAVFANGAEVHGMLDFLRATRHMSEFTLSFRRPVRRAERKERTEAPPPPSSFVVDCDSLPVRAKPSCRGEVRMVYRRGARVIGTPFSVDGESRWLKLHDEQGWVLMTRGSEAKDLLRPLDPAAAELTPEEGPAPCQLAVAGGAGLRRAERRAERQEPRPAGAARPSRLGGPPRLELEADAHEAEARGDGQVLVTVRGAASGQVVAAIRVPPMTLALEIKRRISEVQGTAPLHQRLLLDEKLLEDHDRLDKAAKVVEMQLVCMLPDPKSSRLLLKHTAAGDLAAARRCLRAGASPDHAEPRRGNTPLMAAARIERLDLIQLLARSGAEVNRANNCGATPLHVAAQQGAEPIVKFLCENGADLHAVTQAGTGPLHAASRPGYWKVVRILCEASANVELATKAGVTALQCAVHSGDALTVQALCEARADVDASNIEGEAPLHLAVRRGHLRVVQLLCDCGADKDKSLRATAGRGGGADAAVLEGATPLILAAHRGDSQVLQVLLLAGADKDKRNKAGDTATTVAVKAGHRDAVRNPMKRMSFWGRRWFDGQQEFTALFRSDSEPEGPEEEEDPEDEEEDGDDEEAIGR